MKIPEKYTISKVNDNEYTILIERICSIGIIQFSSQLKINVYIENDIAHIYYDFGMSDDISIEKDNTFLSGYYNCIGDYPDSIKLVFSTIVFDLMHSFFHYNGDPNYSHRHWALYGNLKNRVTTTEIDE